MAAGLFENQHLSEPRHRASSLRRSLTQNCLVTLVVLAFDAPVLALIEYCIVRRKLERAGPDHPGPLRKHPVPVVVDRHGLGLREIRWDARRRNDGIFLSARHSLELRILFDCQRAMIDIALYHSRAS